MHMLPEEWCKGLRYVEPFGPDEVLEDVRFYFGFRDDCMCSYDTDMLCHSCQMLFEVEREHLMKQLDTEKYIQKVKRRFERYRVHREQECQGGYIWKRAFERVKTAYKREAPQEPFDIDNLCRFPWSAPDGDELGPVLPADSEWNVPRLLLTKCGPHRGPPYVDPNVARARAHVFPRGVELRLRDEEKAEEDVLPSAVEVQSEDEPQVAPPAAASPIMSGALGNETPVHSPTRSPSSHSSEATAAVDQVGDVHSTASSDTATLASSS